MTDVRRVSRVAEQGGVARTLWRRWPLVLLGLMVTVMLCAAAGILVPAKYQAKATVLLLPPKSVIGNNSNPYLALVGLQTTADVVSRAMVDSSRAELLQQRGVHGQYFVDSDHTTNGPVLLVLAEDRSPARALAALKVVTREIPPTLVQLQTEASVPRASFITTTVVSEDVKAEVVRKSQVRAIVAAAALGLAGTALGVVLLDNLLATRTRRRRDDDPPAGSRVDYDTGQPPGGRSVPGVHTPGDEDLTVRRLRNQRG